MLPGDGDATGMLAPRAGWLPRSSEPNSAEDARDRPLYPADSLDSMMSEYPDFPGGADYPTSGSAWTQEHHGTHQRPRSAPRDRSHWHWLLLLAIIVPMLTPLYNRTRPELIGIPFFDWCQLAFIAGAAAVTAIVYLATRNRTGA